MATSTSAVVTRRRIQVRGIVQGVGFRPFVYNLAQSLELSGYVFNSSAGVTIEVEGYEDNVEDFLGTLRADPPQLAQITDVEVSAVAAVGEDCFCILNSERRDGEFVLVSPDTGTCEDCWRDFGDKENRRYGYPFTNCTHCGPRYTIIQDIPYDRATTTMSKFRMCSDCEQEYGDPADRRFHAQPNACAECGPSLVLVPSGGSPVAEASAAKDSLAQIRRARALLRAGKILAVKGLGGFLLACDASNHSAVEELRRRKHRSDKPFAVMTRDLASVRSICEVSSAEEDALVHLRRPIVILPRLPEATLAEGVAPENRTVGVMLPYTPLHYLLFGDSSDSEAEFAALVMTSGNLSEEPIVVSNEEALRDLGGIADWFLLHNRDIAMRVDDSVVRIFEGRSRVLRRARGFVPQAIDLEMRVEEVLAFGGELKNTFCLTKDRYAILSPHIGDMENYETTSFFEETLSRMKHMFRVDPRVAAYDLHPGYRSTQMALRSAMERKIGVQHHHAHIVSCMAENHLSGKVIGVAFDGTGFGTDGRIWGGEFLVADLAAFTRRAHLRNVLLPGGDAAVRQPWRMALSYVRDTFGEQIPDRLGCFRGVPDRELQIVNAMLSRRLNTVETSSCGRLFDAVAALTGRGSEVTFEGQAAMSLETIAEKGVEQRYEYIVSDQEPMVLDFRPMVSAIVRDLGSRKGADEISAKFHNTLAAATVEVCCRIRASEGLNEVCLSGGTFQNHYLLEHCVAGLRSREFGVFLHATVPCNDGGISLGQAVIANELLHRGE